MWRFGLSGLMANGPQRERERDGKGDMCVRTHSCMYV